MPLILLRAPCGVVLSALVVYSIETDGAVKVAPASSPSTVRDAGAPNIIRSGAMVVPLIGLEPPSG